MTDALRLPVPPHVTPISPASASGSEVVASPAPPDLLMCLKVWYDLYTVLFYVVFDY